MNSVHSSAVPSPCPHCGYDLREVAGDLCPNCGRRIARQDGQITPTVHWRAFARSLALRIVIALPLAPLLMCASIWASSIFGSAKIQGAPGIMLGLVFGYAFGFGLAEKARRVNAIVWLVLGIVIVAIVAGAALGVHALLPDLIARAGSKRFWFATAAFGGTTIMCAMIALGYESKATILR